MCRRMRGSQDNDGFAASEKGIVKTSNHAGGIMGGISDGSEILLRAAVKPTPSVSQPQATVTEQRRKYFSGDPRPSRSGDRAPGSGCGRGHVRSYHCRRSSWQYGRKTG